MDIQEQLKTLSARTVDLFSPEELNKKLESASAEKRPLRIKYGADPSAPDIHLGHVVGLNKLREFQALGHTVVFIIGDFTGMIGDPSGKSKTRPQLTREEVARNAESYKEQVFKILDPERTEIRFNSEWFADMSFEEVIRLSAKVTVGKLLQRDDFSKRYNAGQEISLVEFLYPLIQAYDSYRVKADVELGGTDQLFNLLLGRELQEKLGQAPQVVMTLPLIEGLDGVQKMSKSLNNYIGVNESPKDIFGKTMSVSDELMWRYFDLVLCEPQESVQAMKADMDAGKRHPRDIKDLLARRVVAVFHGESAGEEASEEFKRVFAQNQLPDDLPEHTVSADRLEDGGIGLIQLLKDTGLTASNKEARRLIEQGGVKIDDEKVDDIHAVIPIDHDLILRAGKRRFVKVKAV